MITIFFVKYCKCYLQNIIICYNYIGYLCIVKTKGKSPINQVFKKIYIYRKDIQV